MPCCIKINSCLWLTTNDRFLFVTTIWWFSYSNFNTLLPWSLSWYLLSTLVWFTIVDEQHLIRQLKWYYDKKITSFFCSKCVCLTLDWQNLELWFLSIGCLLCISRSAITHVQNWPTGPQRIGSREKRRHPLNTCSLKFQHVNAVYYLHCMYKRKTRV